MRLVGYVRVSTDRQAEQGLGLEVQERSIRRWAREHGHVLTRIVSDEGLSGAISLEGREGLLDALGVVRDGSVGGVVVFRLDRLARDLVLQEQLLAEVRRSGGELFSTSSAESAVLVDDPDDPSRRMVRQILGAVSEYERAMIGLRLRSGRRHKAERGGFAYGSPPFGYVAKDRALAPDGAEQATVARITELRRTGTSLRAICDALEAEGRKTKRGGQRWHPAVVRDVLRRAGVPG